MSVALEDLTELDTLVKSSAVISLETLYTFEEVLLQDMWHVSLIRQSAFA